MSYQVIARKYRPQRFEDVVGQEHVTQTLTNAVQGGRIAHAYLFCGPRGTGKTTIARIFAKALNCTGGPRVDFDDQDPRCREIAEGRALDVLEIDGASNNGVEQVRELRETARFAPASSRFKIYIIDEVHMLSPAAFNALLKTLEEPPAHVKFLFATTDPEKVLPTILSRCQRFDLRRIPSALIVKHLAVIAQAEGVAASEAALHAIARGADGGMRDAESTLDQLISFCGERVEEADVLSMFGLTARGQIQALARGILESNTSKVLAELHDLARNGKDFGRLLSDLLHHFRNLMICQVAPGDLALLEVAEDEGAELQKQMALATPDAVTRILDVLTSAEGRLKDASARKIFLEVTLIKAIQARNAVNLDVVLAQLERLRREAGGPPPTVAPPAPSTEARSPKPESTRRSSTPANEPGTSLPIPPGPPSRPTAAPPAPQPESGHSPVSAQSGPPAPVSAASAPLDLQSLWEQVGASVSPMTRPSLQAGRPLRLEKGVLTVGYSPLQETQRSLVDQERTRRLVESKLTELGWPAVVKFVRQEAGEAAAETAPSRPANVPGTAPGLAPAPTPSPVAAPAAQRPASPDTPASPRGGREERAVPIKMSLAEFKNDPLIKEALELFKGHLLESPPSKESPGDTAIDSA